MQAPADPKICCLGVQSSGAQQLVQLQTSRKGILLPICIAHRVFSPMFDCACAPSNAGCCSNVGADEIQSLAQPTSLQATRA